MQEKGTALAAAAAKLEGAVAEVVQALATEVAGLEAKALRKNPKVPKRSGGGSEALR